jgi:guanylate kinase
MGAGARLFLRHAEEAARSCGQSGTDIFLDIDVQGARKIKQAYPEAVAIFVLPPSMTELKRRLSTRGTDDKAIIERRLANARGEMSEIIKYDYYVVNRELGAAIRSLSAIVEAERARTARVRRWLIEPLRH